MERMNISEAFMICSGINSMSGNQYFHLSPTSMQPNDHSESGHGKSWDISGNLFLHVLSFLSWFTILQHGQARLSGRMRTVFWTGEDCQGNREKEHHLVLINIQFGVSQLVLQWHSQGKVDIKRLKILVGDDDQNFNPLKV